MVRGQLELDGKPAARRLSTSPRAVRMRVRRRLLRLADDVDVLSSHTRAVYFEPTACTRANLNGLAEIAERLAAELRQAAELLPGAQP